MIAYSVIPLAVVLGVLASVYTRGRPTIVKLGVGLVVFTIITSVLSTLVGSPLSPALSGGTMVQPLSLIHICGTTMDITMQVHLRKDLERLGIAPMTSMYWYSETVKGAATDWRPEIHDSDGLAMWTGKGEHLWRPLENSAMLTRCV